MDEHNETPEEGNDFLAGATKDQSDYWKPSDYWVPEEKHIKDGLDRSSWKIVLTNKPPENFPIELLDENGELNLKSHPITEEEFMELSRKYELQKDQEEALRNINKPRRDYVQ